MFINSPKYILIYDYSLGYHVCLRDVCFRTGYCPWSKAECFCFLSTFTSHIFCLLLCHFVFFNEYFSAALSAEWWLINFCHNTREKMASVEWEEVKRLAKDFQRAQLTSATQKWVLGIFLSNKNSKFLDWCCKVVILGEIGAVLHHML